MQGGDYNVDNELSREYSQRIQTLITVTDRRSLEAKRCQFAFILLTFDVIILVHHFTSLHEVNFPMCLKE